MINVSSHSHTPILGAQPPVDILSMLCCMLTCCMLH